MLAQQRRGEYDDVRASGGLLDRFDIVGESDWLADAAHTLHALRCTDIAHLGTARRTSQLAKRSVCEQLRMKAKGNISDRATVWWVLGSHRDVPPIGIDSSACTWLDCSSAVAFA
jgi:hypothetical protein